MVLRLKKMTMKKLNQNKEHACETFIIARLFGDNIKKHIVTRMGSPKGHDYKIW